MITDTLENVLKFLQNKINMCLHVKEENNKILIAEENMVCYKLLSGNCSPHCQYRYKKYKINILHKDLKLKTRDVREICSCDEGFHSRNNLSTNNNGIINDNYLSEPIIYLGKNNFINRFIARKFYEIKSKILKK